LDFRVDAKVTGISVTANAIGGEDPSVGYYDRPVAFSNPLTGVVALVGAQPTADVATTDSKLARVVFTLAAGTTGYILALEPGATTYLGNITQPKLPGDSVVGTVSTAAIQGNLKFVLDSGSALATPGDNEFHYRVSHPTQTIDVNGSKLNVAQLDFSFDTNAAVGTTTASETLSMLFVETTQSPLQLTFNDFYLV
jgi:hypothetical protein